MTRPPSTLVTKLVLIAALALLGITALTSYSSIQRFFEAAQWVDHTRLVMLRLEELMSELEHAESRQRGYLISGNEQYLEPYRATVKALPGRIRALRADSRQPRATKRHRRLGCARVIALGAHRTWH